MWRSVYTVRPALNEEGQVVWEHWPSGADDEQREAVVALGADRLNHSARQARYFTRALDHSTNALHRLITRGGIGDGAVADDVVGEDERTGPAEADRDFEVVRIADLVGIDEDEIERGDGVGFEPAKDFESGAEVEADAFEDSGAAEVRARNLGVPRIDFDSDQLPAGRQCAGQPDAAVAGERPEFEDAPGPDSACEREEKFALRRRDSDRRQARGSCRRPNRSKRGVGVEKSGFEIGVYAGPTFIDHVGSVAWERLRGYEATRLRGCEAARQQGYEA